jgi:hypothetical protein
MKRFWRAIPRTTVGRFWGYVSVAVAMGVSLAGNLQAARLQTPDVPPTLVEYAFAGLPPLVAFGSIELVNHNRWEDAPWGKYIVRVLMGVVAPGSALVSFVHLATVSLDASGITLDGTVDKYLHWGTSILTALLIDGLVVGGTAALLLPKEAPETPIPATPLPITDLRGALEQAVHEQMAALAAVSQVPVNLLPDPPLPDPPKPRVRTPKPRVGPAALYDDWITDGRTWDSKALARKAYGVEEPTEAMLSTCRSTLSRWKRADEKTLTLK